MTAARLSQLPKRLRRWVAADHQRTQGRITSSHQELVCVLQRDQGHISHRLRTLEGRAGDWALVWRASRISEAHPRGSEMGLTVCRKL